MPRESAAGKASNPKNLAWHMDVDLEAYTYSCCPEFAFERDYISIILLLFADSRTTSV